MDTLLLVEDDHVMSGQLENFFTREGFKVSLANGVNSAKSAMNDSIDLALVDWMLPDGEGIDLVKEWRQEHPALPIVMITAKSNITEKIVGLELGSNDYVTKPFDPIELLARVRTHIRQAKSIEKLSPVEKKIINISGIKVNSITREVHFNSKSISLTKTQFSLLKLLVSNPGKVFSRDELLEKVWGYESYPSTRTVDNHIVQLRQKLIPNLFETLHGIGYRFLQK